jgi:3-oxoacyl-[acyl-carrier-protein] synthase III
MKPISLVGVASYLPERIIDNSFFGQGSQSKNPMFRGTKFRRHLAPGQTAAAMIERAAHALRDQLGLRFEQDVDILLTNVSCPDAPFTGCGGTVAYRLGCSPQWIFDLHNTGCISFVYMIALAQSLMESSGARTALICNVQTAAGRVFALEGNRDLDQAVVPGDGCGVGYLVSNDQSPVLSLVTRNNGRVADDMRIVRKDGRAWWEPGLSPGYLDFNEERIAEIVSIGNRVVPQAVREACRQAQLEPGAIDVLVTNQPSPIFLRNWREALLLPKEKHVDTFEEHGNLFGAALPICIERAIETNVLRPGGLLALGGFSHAGDYVGAALVRWQQAEANLDATRRRAS